MRRGISITGFAFFLVLFLYSLSLSEEITITTYYPSPYGSYKDLRADQMAIGSTYRTATLSDGNLMVSGNVGIGTNSPGEKLDVVGTVKMTGFKMATGAGDQKVLTSDADGVGTWATSTDLWAYDASVGSGTWQIENINSSEVQIKDELIVGNCSMGDVALCVGGNIYTSGNARVSGNMDVSGSTVETLAASATDPGDCEACWGNKASWVQTASSCQA